MRVMSWTRCRGLDWSHSLLCLTLLMWTRSMSGLADFSGKMMVMWVGDYGVVVVVVQTMRTRSISVTAGWV